MEHIRRGRFCLRGETRWRGVRIRRCASACDTNFLRTWYVFTLITATQHALIFFRRLDDLPTPRRAPRAGVSDVDGPPFTLARCTQLPGIFVAVSLARRIKTDVDVDDPPFRVTPALAPALARPSVRVTSPSTPRTLRRASVGSVVSNVVVVVPFSLQTGHRQLKSGRAAPFRCCWDWHGKFLTHPSRRALTRHRMG